MTSALTGKPWTEDRPDTSPVGLWTRLGAKSPLSFKYNGLLRRPPERRGRRIERTEEADGVRIRHVSRVSTHGRDDRRTGIRDLVRTGRRRRALGPRRHVAGRNPCRAGALGVLGAADLGERHRRAHEAHEDRYRGPGIAVVSP